MLKECLLFDFHRRIGGGGECADVRPVLRRVFRLHATPSVLPTLTPCASETRLDKEHWSERYAPSPDPLRQCESALRHKAASRSARAPPRNAFHLRRTGHCHVPLRPLATPALASIATACLNRHLLGRADLKPALDQDACRDHSLWVQNTLACSSGNLSEPDLTLRGVCGCTPRETLLNSNYSSEYSYSIGSIAPLHISPPTPPPPIAPRVEMVMCIPPQIDFINFNIGELYTAAVRLVNMSSMEVKVSVRPPIRRELDVQLCGRLSITSGASTELRVHFRPRDVRRLRDELRVRVSVGQNIHIPINCYMEPPILDVVVTNAARTVHGPSALPASEMTMGGNDAPVGDVLDLGARLLGDTHRVHLLLRCGSEHASFFVLPEDAWLMYAPAELTQCGTLLCGVFALQPVWWGEGRGAVKGSVWCRARAVGLQTMPLRLLSSTAIARPLMLLADSLYFHPEHVTLQAQEKNYDICSDDDPDCEHYVNLGVAFPGRPLSATVQLLNHSGRLLVSNTKHGFARLLNAQFDCEHRITLPPP